MWTRIALLFILALTSLRAADGVSAWPMPGPNGDPVKAQMVLKQDGEKLTGSFLFSESRKLGIADDSSGGQKASQEWTAGRKE